jgi:hypothetical protein
MMLSERELTQARETVASLLETLGLTAYLFEVEPREGRWEVRVECALDSDAQGCVSAAQGRTPGAAGWQSATFAVDGAQLAAARTDTPTRDALLADWRHRLTPPRPA